MNGSVLYYDAHIFFRVMISNFILYELHFSLTCRLPFNMVSFNSERTVDSEWYKELEITVNKFNVLTCLLSVFVCACCVCGGLFLILFMFLFN